MIRTINVPASDLEARMGDPAAVAAAIEAMPYNDDCSKKDGPDMRQTTIETKTGRWTIKAILVDTGGLYGPVRTRWKLSLYPAAWTADRPFS